ncbi:MAG: DNA replication protein, partial [Proteobacteria bacterium]|nr:DNA replication protein [Pseudomonadota bacterium]
MSASDRRTNKATRRPKSQQAEIVDAFRAQHLALSAREIMTEAGAANVIVNDSESPLAWLARRKGRDGRAMISQDQFIAGEKLRADFTRGNLTPRVTSNWSAPTG